MGEVLVRSFIISEELVLMYISYSLCGDSRRNLLHVLFLGSCLLNAILLPALALK